MKTIDQVIELYKSNAIDGRDVGRLLDFLPEEKLHIFGMELKDEYKGTHVPMEMTREAVLEKLERDVEFGFDKAFNKRGISSSLMYEVVRMWNWILEEGLEDFDDYPQYGLPLFKETAVKYGFNNPIGDSNGDEIEFTQGYEEDRW